MSLDSFGDVLDDDEDFFGVDKDFLGDLDVESCFTASTSFFFTPVLSCAPGTGDLPAKARSTSPNCPSEASRRRSDCSRQVSPVARLGPYRPELEGAALGGT